MKNEYDAEYFFTGVEIKNTIPGIGNRERFYLKGQANIGDVLIDFKFPISQKSFDDNAGQQLSELTLALMHQAIQVESLKEYLESQSEN